VVAGFSIGTEILDEIENASVAFDRNKVQVHITNQELIINGVKQSDQVHSKVIEKFFKRPDNTINFNYRSHP
jgi:bla regulator protein blaR1